jgi:hypothetical protein
MNWKKIWEETAVAYFKAVSRHMYGETKKIQANVRVPSLGRDLKTGISKQG